MEDKIKFSNVEDLNKSSLRFIGHDKKEILRLNPGGSIIWFLNGEEIIVKEKSLLAIALLDLVIRFSSMDYDYSKLDPELWKQYQEFLKTKKA